MNSPLREKLLPLLVNDAHTWDGLRNALRGMIARHPGRLKYVANEGKLIAIVPADAEEQVLEVMRAHRYGADAQRIGTCVPDHRGMVVARTGLGGTRVIDLPIGEQLPRIC
jgi:hypothetical protein